VNKGIEKTTFCELGDSTGGAPIARTDVQLAKTKFDISVSVPMGSAGFVGQC
jgi:hypothetical protein